MSKAVITVAAMLMMAMPTTQAAMRKLCLFFPPSGHVGTDPIISQTCLSNHVHTFYRPQQFHPETNFGDLLKTPSQFSSINFEENKSLYWHPTIYQFNPIDKSYLKSQIFSSTAYYKFDDSVDVMAFPQDFKMIAGLQNDGRVFDREPIGSV